jgi:predicted transport protein
MEELMDYTQDSQVQTMIKNMPERTGKSLDEWFIVLSKARLEKHGEMVKLLKEQYGVTHGFANTIILIYRQQSEGGLVENEDLIAAQYSGAKAGLRPIYDELIKTIKSFGKDVELAPKKAYVSLRRSKQFGLLQPSAKDRLDLGLVLNGAHPQGKLEASGAFSSMCTHRIRLTRPEDIDQDVIAWLRRAYEQS